MTESVTPKKAYPPFVSLVLRGEDIDPQRMTTLLKISPHKSARKGEKKTSGNQDKKWSYGFWILDSSKQIDSSDPIMHIVWLLDQLEPSKMGLVEISNDHTIDSEISCFWVMPSNHEILTIPPELLNRIAALNIRFELDIYSPR
jgi:hypothetical protein